MNHGEIVSFIWGVADLIRDTFRRGKYQDVILPLTVLRRLDCVLAPTKEKVLQTLAKYKGKGLENLDQLLRKASGFAFYRMVQSHEFVETVVAHDLLVCEGGEIGRTAIWRGELSECYYQKAIHRLRPIDASEHPRYFLHVMYAAAHLGMFVAESHPNTIDHLTAVKLRHHRFPFPRGDEQRAIATFLDQERGRLDGLIARIREGIGRLSEYRTALISAAVTGKIDVRGEAE